MTGQTLAEIDNIIKACDGDTRGALRVLMLMNQELQLQVAELQSDVAELQQTVEVGKTYARRAFMRASMH